MKNDFINFLKKAGGVPPKSPSKKTPKSSATRQEKDFSREIEQAFDHFRLDQLKEDIRQREIEEATRKTMLMNNEEVNIMHYTREYVFGILSKFMQRVQSKR